MWQSFGVSVPHPSTITIYLSWQSNNSIYGIYPARHTRLRICSEYMDLSDRQLMPAATPNFAPLQSIAYVQRLDLTRRGVDRCQCWMDCGEVYSNYVLVLLGYFYPPAERQASADEKIAWLWRKSVILGWRTNIQLHDKQFGILINVVDTGADFPLISRGKVSIWASFRLLEEKEMERETTNEPASVAFAFYFFPQCQRYGAHISVKRHSPECSTVHSSWPTLEWDELILNITYQAMIIHALKVVC